MVRKALAVLKVGLIVLSACKKKENGGDEGGLPYPVVVEQVTNYMCVPCKGANEIIDSLDEAYGDKLIVVRYHANDPYVGDPVYTPYTDSVLSLYGLSTSDGVPITVIGGDYSEHGYDDTRKDDYVEKWNNLILERGQRVPKYSISATSLVGDSLAVIDVSLSPGKAASDVVRTMLTEYHVPLPSGSVKPYSNYAVRAGTNSTHAEFVVDTSWNTGNLYVTVVVNSSDGKVVGAYRGEAGTYTLKNVSNGGDTTAPLNQYTSVYLRMENRTDRDLNLTFKISGIPRDWSNTICWGMCLSDTFMVSNTLPAGSTTPEHGMYFAVYPTTLDTANITVRVYLNDDPRIFRELKVRVISE